MWPFSKPEPSTSPKPDRARFELELLSRFRAPQDPAWLERDGRWREAFGESPLNVVARLRESGQLVTGSLEEQLSTGYTVKGLKDLCRSNGLKVSGTRDVLLTRLVEAIPDTIRTLVSGKTVLSCSPEVRELVERLEAEKDAKRTAAETDAREALRARDLKRACRAVVEFEAGQPFPRGLGIDWTRYDSQSDLVSLSILFERWPRILNFVPAEDRDAFRVAAAEMFLWGVSRPLRSMCLPEVKGRLSADVVVQSLVCFAQMERKFQGLRTSSAKSITLVRDDSCSGCQKGPSVFEIRSLPEIPRPECTNPDGCRCYFIANWE